MENGTSDFLSRLEQAITLRASWLETVRIPLLREMVRTYRSLFESLMGTLVKKGLLREDQYDWDGKVTAITVPPDTALSDPDDYAEVSSRIVACRRQLDFLADGLPFTLVALDLPIARRVAALVAYVDWGSFGEGSHSPTTRALSRLVTNVRLSKDALTSRVLTESQAMIEKLSRDILGCLSELEAWHRESWKLDVRSKVMPRVPPQRARTGEERTTKVLLIRKVFEQALPEGTWHANLVQEILAEDQEPGSSERLDRLLSSLALPGIAIEQGADPARLHSGLLQAVRGLCDAAEEIGRCEEALVENERALEARRLSFLQRIRRWFQRSLGRLDDRFYDIENGESTESVDFLKLVSEMKELKALLMEIRKEGSAGDRRVAGMDEDQLCDFLDWQLRLVRQLHRRMEGLNSLFQVKAAHERALAARSIKLELLAIENAMIRADAVRRESISRLERKLPAT
jgi:hypothetical protein